jgi:hypothetical protein
MMMEVAGVSGTVMRIHKYVPTFQKTEVFTGGWRKLHNEELRNLTLIAKYYWNN